MAAERAVSVWRSLAGVPSISASRIVPKGNGVLEVQARWTQRELERGKNISFTKSYFIKTSTSGVELLTSCSHQGDASSICKETYSDDSQVRAVLLNDKPASADSASEPLQYIEIWNGDRLVKTIDVKSIKKHGKIHEDDHFGSFCLSGNGHKLLYIAEREKAKTESFFKKETKPEPDTTPIEKGLEYVHETSWGEQLTSVVNPVAVVMDLESEDVTIVDHSKYGEISAGQAQWVPRSDSELMFIGYENQPRKLGFLFCFNKRSAIYHANITSGTCDQLTRNDQNHYGPRFNPQGSMLVFFETPAVSAHRPCARISMMKWADKSVSMVMDVVSTPKAPDYFPGFYVPRLPRRSWDSTGRFIILASHWSGIIDVTIIDTQGSKVKRVVTEGMTGTWNVMDVCEDLIIAQFTSPSNTPKLFVGALGSAFETGVIEWTLLAAPSDPALLKDVTWSPHSFTPSLGPDIPFQALLVSDSRSAKPRPLVVYPHGGPHGAYSPDFYLWQTAFVLLGYSVLLVNYRGSCGFGQDSIDSLPGHVGSHDVRDVQDCAEWAVAREDIDESRVFVVGGSHGGFLVAHLLGQFPDFYRAGCALNPVTCFPLSCLTSDIPEWAYLEAGLAFDPAKPPSDQELSQLLSVSPIKLAPQIKAPLLFCVGGKDLRCPPSQSFSVYNILKAMGKETRLLWYPNDCHPIKILTSNSDAFVNTALWFEKHGK